MGQGEEAALARVRRSSLGAGGGAACAIRRGERPGLLPSLRCCACRFSPPTAAACATLSAATSAAFLRLSQAPTQRACLLPPPRSGSSSRVGVRRRPWRGRLCREDEGEPEEEEDLESGGRGRAVSLSSPSYPPSARPLTWTLARLFHASASIPSTSCENEARSGGDLGVSTRHHSPPRRPLTERLLSSSARRRSPTSCRKREGGGDLGRERTATTPPAVLPSLAPAHACHAAAFLRSPLCSHCASLHAAPPLRPRPRRPPPAVAQSSHTVTLSCCCRLLVV